MPAPAEPGWAIQTTAMKVNITKTGTYTFTGLTRKQYHTISYILRVANERCFGEQDEDGSYYSNDDFVCSLDKEEREALRRVCEKF